MPDDYGRRHRVAYDGHDAGGRAARTDAPWPGKRTLTQSLAPAWRSPEILRKADGDGLAADARARLDAADASAGAPLPADLRQRFEASTGADLSSVRVHTGAASQQAASAVSARAYTVGRDIHFADGQYDPASADGQRLIAHEVAHTVQQDGGAPVRQHKLEVSMPGDAAEVEADRAADAMVMGAPAVIGGAIPVIAREAGAEPVKAGDDLNAPPPKYATLDHRVRDLMWRSKETFEPFKKVADKPFWERLDQVGVADLQTCVQVLVGAQAAGLLPSIQQLLKIYTYGSSWGIEFKGPTPPVGYPGWGSDLQWFVRREHGDTAHTWYRQNSGAGNPGLHCGVDSGAGHHNLHWDPTNPMSGVGEGVTFIGIPPFVIPVGYPKGEAIYSPSALIEHAQDIGKLPGGDGHTKPRANQPFLDISLLSNDFATVTKDYADMEQGKAAEHIDKDRATAAINQLRGASAAAKALAVEAHPIAMQDNTSNKAAVDDLTAKTDKVRTRVFEALAGFFQHLQYEACGYPSWLGGHTAVTDWTMNTPALHATYDKVVGLQEHRAKLLKAKKAHVPSGDGDAGVEPLPGGLACDVP